MTPVHSDKDEQSKETQGMQAEETPLLFINRCSKEPIGRCQGPSRTAVSVHVQRTIRKKKQHDAMMRLKSREFSKGLFKYRIAKTDVDGDVASPHQSSIHTDDYPFQRPSWSEATMLQSTPEHNLETQFNIYRQVGSSNQIWTSQFVTVETSAPFSDTVIPLSPSQSRSAEIALRFCESVPCLMAFNSFGVVVSYVVSTGFIHTKAS